MNQNEELGQKNTTNWFMLIPKWLRYILIYGGLIALIYFANKGIWF